MKTKRICSGVYEVTTKNHTFTVERMNAISEDGGNDNTWMLCELVGYNKEYWNHFATKKEAIEAIKRSK